MALQSNVRKTTTKKVKEQPKTVMGKFLDPTQWDENGDYEEYGLPRADWEDDVMIKTQEQYPKGYPTKPWEFEDVKLLSGIQRYKVWIVTKIRQGLKSKDPWIRLCDHPHCYCLLKLKQIKIDDEEKSLCSLHKLRREPKEKEKETS